MYYLVVRVLTADERAELFNLGRGKYYAFD